MFKHVIALYSYLLKITPGFYLKLYNFSNFTLNQLSIKLFNHYEKHTFSFSGCFYDCFVS